MRAQYVTEIPSLGVESWTGADLISPQEMSEVAPKVKEVMGTWRWIWRTGHGHILPSDDHGGIAFRMYGDEPLSNPTGIVGRMRYDPQLVNTDATRWDFRFEKEVPGAMEISIDMSGDDDKKNHAFEDARAIPARLRFTVQPGKRNRESNMNPHQRLLCVKYIDPTEGEVELFALAQNRRNKEDGPRGFPSTTPGRPNETVEEESPSYGYEQENDELLWEFGVGRAVKEPQWYEWLGWKGAQKGWYNATKEWTFW